MTKRDPRMDFFRGIAIFVIFISHLPDNSWELWTPARWGFSDSAEIFVFCSGLASGLAFGSIFAHCGQFIGSARVLYRAWQIYWAHICLFFATVGTVTLIQLSGWVSNDYIERLNLWPFFQDPLFSLPALLTLTYVPNLFDILPLYVVLIALIAPMMLVHSLIGRLGVFLLVFYLWIIANLGFLNLPAEPWSDRPWFFNPFAWQLLFFTGFAFMRGWLSAPPRSNSLILLSILILFMSIPFASFRFTLAYPALAYSAELIEPLTSKTDMGLLRLLHFLALAYLAWRAVGEGGKRLLMGGLGGKLVAMIRKVGEQSLATFLASIYLGQLIAIGRDSFFNLDQEMLLTTGLETEAWETIISNLIGFIALIAVAYLAGWFKAKPWKKPS
ncbi:OpgC family protein [Flexibacterium corallicola]|uniref:OpgC family protein n=1 Tax=Flexibacterium corallicola TaxID=3037259 RepID=UPI00286F2C6D|nr:OpgC domain-containing protein [Pseudovibrio sp. M1P-2-3]